MRTETLCTNMELGIRAYADRLNGVDDYLSNINNPFTKLSIEQLVAFIDSRDDPKVVEKIMKLITPAQRSQLQALEERVEEEVIEETLTEEFNNAEEIESESEEEVDVVENVSDEEMFDIDDEDILSSEVEEIKSADIEDFSDDESEDEDFSDDESEDEDFSDDPEEEDFSDDETEEEDFSDDETEEEDFLDDETEDEEDFSDKASEIVASPDISQGTDFVSAIASLYAVDNEEEDEDYSDGEDEGEDECESAEDEDYEAENEDESEEDEISQVENYAPQSLSGQLSNEYLDVEEDNLDDIGGVLVDEDEDEDSEEESDADEEELDAIEEEADALAELLAPKRVDPLPESSQLFSHTAMTRAIRHVEETQKLSQAIEPEVQTASEPASNVGITQKSSASTSLRPTTSSIPVKSSGNKMRIRKNTVVQEPSTGDFNTSNSICGEKFDPSWSILQYLSANKDNKEARHIDVVSRYFPMNLIKRGEDAGQFIISKGYLRK